MKLFRISLLAALFVIAISCSDKKEKKDESGGKTEDKAIATDSVMPMVEDYADEATDDGYEKEENAVDGEPVPGAEIYLEQEPVGED